MKMYQEPQPLSAYLNVPLECSCGRTHFVPIKAVEISAGALQSVPEYLKKYGYSHPYIICDRITRAIAGERCAALLEEAGISAKLLELKHMLFDEATLGEIVINKPDDCDLMIGVGTGSITDMLRYSSFKLGLPALTVATGAPMDGFAASIGVMNVNNLKCTLPAHNSEIIIGDTDLLKTAPYRMTVAGFGDLIGKLSCLNDWELARIINGEHYCEPIVKLVSNRVREILAQADRIRDRDGEVLGSLMDGLCLSGAAISLYGDSRPASGAEHHMSHYWETIGEQQGKTFAMHGEQVAVGTVLALMLARELAAVSPDFNRARLTAQGYNVSEWEQSIREAYGIAADEIIALENKSGKNAVEGRLRRIDSMEERWDEVRKQLLSLPSPEELIEVMRSIGCPCTPAEIGVDKALLKRTFMVCKEVRPRYTIFQTCFDLDLLDELSDRVIEALPNGGELR